MLIRQCSGGVVFNQNKVLVLRNDKGEWVFPKGVIRDVISPGDVAVSRVQVEAGVKARIVSQLTKTSYEFFSLTRRQPVANRIVWYVMIADSTVVTPNHDQDFTDGGFYGFEEALQLVTYSQDKNLLTKAIEAYQRAITT